MKITFYSNGEDQGKLLNFNVIDFKKVENIDVVDPSHVRITAI